MISFNWFLAIEFSRFFFNCQTAFDANGKLYNFIWSQIRRLSLAAWIFWLFRAFQIEEVGKAKTKKTLKFWKLEFYLYCTRESRVCIGLLYRVHKKTLLEIFRIAYWYYQFGIYWAIYTDSVLLSDIYWLIYHPAFDNSNL